MLDDGGLNAAADAYVQRVLHSEPHDELPWMQEWARALALTSAGTLEPSFLLQALLALAGVRTGTERHRKKAAAAINEIEAKNGVNGALPLHVVVGSRSVLHAPPGMNRAAHLASDEFAAAEAALAVRCVTSAQAELLERLQVRSLLAPKEGEPRRNDGFVLFPAFAFFSHAHFAANTRPRCGGCETLRCSRRVAAPL